MRNRLFMWWLLMVVGFVLTVFVPSLLVGPTLLLVGAIVIFGPIAFVCAVYIGVLAGGKTFALVIVTFINALSNPAKTRALLEKQKRIKASNANR